MKQISLLLFVSILVAACDNSGGWSTAQKQKALKSCMDGMPADADQALAKKVCDCAVEKMMKKYPSYAEADKKGSEQEGAEIGRQCAQEVLAGKNGNDNGGNTGGTGGGLGGGLGNGGGGNWTQQQLQQYVQGCAATAQQAQGMTAEQATAYCECMTRKVAQKYSFEAAAKLTAADFQTQEWIDAANDCRAQIMREQ